MSSMYKSQAIKFSKRKKTQRFLWSWASILPHGDVRRQTRAINLCFSSPEKARQKQPVSMGNLLYLPNSSMGAHMLLPLNIKRESCAFSNASLWDFSFLYTFNMLQPGNTFTALFQLQEKHQPGASEFGTWRLLPRAAVSPKAEADCEQHVWPELRTL